MKIFLAQLNPIVGDISGNLARALDVYAEAKKVNADIVVFSELFICGYSPQDLILKPAFLQSCEEAIKQLLLATEGNNTAILIGSPVKAGDKIYNSALLIDNGKILAQRDKVDLPNYQEFDDYRVFDAGTLPDVILFRGVKIATPICEDIWHDDDLFLHLSNQGAELFLVMNASPYCRDKLKQRHELVKKRVKQTGCSFVYVNQVGGQDDLIYDGGSFIYDKNGRCLLHLNQFEEETACYDTENSGLAVTPQYLDSCETDYRACVLGLRDYVLKNKFSKVILGLSGGVDSAICLAIAVDALGPEAVECYMLPYLYTSSSSLADAEECAKLLGVKYEVISIASAVDGTLATLSEKFSGLSPDLTEENIQSRLRGVILMALSNKFNSLLITTGNKSEMAVGYATLYGDMNGAYNPIKDLYKTEVYKLCHWRNSNYPEDVLGPRGVVIPENIITKEPSAELRPDQKDSDSLPPYEILDGILTSLIEKNFSIKEIIEQGYDKRIVERVENLLYQAEYKRNQAAPGPKLSSLSFGIDRRYPITQRYRDRLN